LAVPALLTTGAYVLGSTMDRPREDRVIRNTQQLGGAPPLTTAILKTLDDLIVPLGLMTGAHFLQQQRVGPVSTDTDRDVVHRDVYRDVDYRYGTRGKRLLQRGGNLWRNVLDLSVPLGLTLIAHSLGDSPVWTGSVSRSTRDSPIGTGSVSGSRPRRIGYELEGGAALPIIGDTYLGRWLSENGIQTLLPTTLLPLGLIFVLYMAYRRYVTTEPVASGTGTGETRAPEAKVSSKPTITDMGRKKDLKRYMTLRGIHKLNPDTKFPFALAMGPETFRAYVKQM